MLHLKAQDVTAESLTFFVIALCLGQYLIVSILYCNKEQTRLLLNPPTCRRSAEVDSFVSYSDSL